LVTAAAASRLLSAVPTDQIRVPSWCFIASGTAFYLLRFPRDPPLSLGAALPPPSERVELPALLAANS